MDRQLLERLIGAGVLVVALVVVVPAILDGDTGDSSPRSSADGTSPADVPAMTNEPRRTHTIRLDEATESPPVARQIADPAPDPALLDVKPSSGSRSESVTAAKPQPVTKVAAKPVIVAKVKTSSESAPSRTKPASIPESGWVVQLGSFSSRQNAQRLADEVSGHGFPVFLMPLNRSGKTLYRVRVGPRNTRAQAAELAGRLAKAGYTGQLAQQRPDA